MVESICDEHPSDIAYSADQMVDAFSAGARHRASQDAEIAAMKAERERLREALDSANYLINRLDLAWKGKPVRDLDEAFLRWGTTKTALASSRNSLIKTP